MVEEDSTQVHGISEVAMQTLESEAALVQIEDGLAEEEAQEVVQAVEGVGQGGMSRIIAPSPETDRCSLVQYHTCAFLCKVPAMSYSSV